MRKLMISIALVALMLTGCSQKEARTTAVEDVATNTVATIGDASADATIEEVAEEPAPEKETLEASNEVTTEASTIGGGKKKAEETTEEQKPTTNGGASNSGSQKPSSASNGGSKPSTTEAPKPSSNGNSSNGSNSSENSNTTPSPKPSTPATTEAPTTQHQHVYNVWHKTKDAWTETIVDTPEQTITHPAEYKTVPAIQCNTCLQVFTSGDAFSAHKTRNGGWCDSSGNGTVNTKEKVKDEWTETIPAKTHTVNHPEEGYWTCSCGARE